MILLDTCAIVFDALAPGRLSAPAKEAIEKGEREGTLACADISLWEIAMLVQKGRLDPGAAVLEFLQTALAFRELEVLGITPEIAALSASLPSVRHHDPADRLIAATAVRYGASLVTADDRLRSAEGISTVW